MDTFWIEFSTFCSNWYRLLYTTFVCQSANFSTNRLSLWSGRDFIMKICKTFLQCEWVRATIWCLFWATNLKNSINSNYFASVKWLMIKKKIYDPLQSKIYDENWCKIDESTGKSRWKVLKSVSPFVNVDSAKIEQAI